MEKAIKLLDISMTKPRATKFILDQISSVIRERQQRRAEEGAMNRKQRDMIDLFIEAIETEVAEAEKMSSPVEKPRQGTYIYVYMPHGCWSGQPMYVLQKNPKVLAHIRVNIGQTKQILID